MSFLEYVVLLQRRWRSWVSMIIIGLLVALAVSMLAEKQYTAVSTSFVTVADEDAAGSGEIFQGSQFAVQRMASYAALASSPEVMQAVIDDLELDLTMRGLRQIVEVSSPPGLVMLEVSVEHEDPKRAAEIADSVSEQLGLFIEDLETPRGLAASSVMVTLTHPAGVPVDPSSPRTTLNLILGLAGGVAAGVLLALLREHFDRRIKSPDDIRGVTGARPLGSTIAVRGRESDPLVALRARSVEAERYRTVKTALKLAHGRTPLHHFVVSAPTDGDGTGSEAANLAISWALGGTRVCLVDARLRRPAVTSLLGIDSTIGLTDVLVGDVDLDTVLTPWHDGLVTVVPSGPLPLDPVELLGSRAMAELIAGLRSRFDLVIYDADPVLDAADAVVLARVLDGLVLVVRAGETTRDELTACLDIVTEAGAPLLGTVRAGVKTRAGHRSAHAGPDARRPLLQERQDAALSPHA